MYVYLLILAVVSMEYEHDKWHTFISNMSNVVKGF